MPERRSHIQRSLKGSCAVEPGRDSFSRVSGFAVSLEARNGGHVARSRRNASERSHNIRAPRSELPALLRCCCMLIGVPRHERVYVLADRASTRSSKIRGTTTRLNICSFAVTCGGKVLLNTAELDGVYSLRERHGEAARSRGLCRYRANARRGAGVARTPPRGLRGSSSPCCRAPTTTVSPPEAALGQASS